MAKLSAAVAESPATEALPLPVATASKWDAFTKACVAPVDIVCQAYPPVHRSDGSCHTRLRHTAEALLRHIEPDHGSGGGLLFRLRPADKPWGGWAKFGAAALEIADFRCEVCDEIVPIHPSHIQKHMKSHSGKTRRVRAGGEFNFTLTTFRVEPTADEAFEDEG